MITHLKKYHAENYSFEKKLIYLYFILLIFEGALRKWFLPGFSSIFVVIRDPIILILVVQGLRKGFLSNKFCISSILLSLVSIIVSAFTDTTSYVILYYGTRIFMLYFPAIFVIPHFFTLKDFYNIGRWTIYISIPMTALVFVQYFSPQNSIVNIGVGGDLDGSGFGGAMGYYRPSGFFSFTQGYVTFQSLVLSYIFAYFFDKRAQEIAPIKNVILIFSLLCYIISVPLSISRTLLFQTMGLLLFVFVGATITRRNIKRILSFSLLVLIIIPILFQFKDFQLFIDVFYNRFNSAAESEGNVISGTIVDRYFGAFLRPWELDVPFWGHGIGLGTRLSLKFFPSNFLTDEEWTRIFYESGPLLGSCYIALRVLLSFELFLKSFKSIRLTQNLLPIIFLPTALFLLPQGSWGNAVPLGFTVLIVSFLIISIDSKNESHNLPSNR